MPRHETIAVETNWDLLTTADVTSVTFQNRGPDPVQIVPTVGANPPSDADDGLIYQAGEGEVAVAMTDLAPGIAGANRLYARSSHKKSDVLISHA